MIYGVVAVFENPLRRSSSLLVRPRLNLSDHLQIYFIVFEVAASQRIMSFSREFPVALDLFFYERIQSQYDVEFAQLSKRP